MTSPPKHDFIEGISIHSQEVRRKVPWYLWTALYVVIGILQVSYVGSHPERFGKEAFSNPAVLSLIPVWPVLDTLVIGLIITRYLP